MAIKIFVLPKKHLQSDLLIGKTVGSVSLMLLILGLKVDKCSSNSDFPYNTMEIK
jgi:hypothetical protein